MREDNMPATIDRWTVRRCPVHGLVADGERYCPVFEADDICGRLLSEPFEVVRAIGARTADPDTSKLAAFRQVPRSASQRGRILAALAQHGPMTSRQIEEQTQISGAWKRVSELKQGGHIYEARVQRDPQTNTDVTVYAIAGKHTQPADGPDPRVWDEPAALF